MSELTVNRGKVGTVPDSVTASRSQANSAVCTYLVGCEQIQNQSPIVAEANRTPAAMDDQNPSPRRSENAIGINSGKPSGTRTSVSRASRETVVISCSLFHTATKATMLTIGRVSNNAPSRGKRSASSETPATTIPATTALHHMFVTPKRILGCLMPTS